MSSTYDISTLIGKTRFHISDTVIAATTFDDSEIQYCLDLAKNNPMLAAAYALESLATQRARIASIIRTGNVTRNMGQIAEALADRAQSLRNLAASNLTLSDIYGSESAAGPDPVFTPTTGGGQFPGSMEGW